MGFISKLFGRGGDTIVTGEQDPRPKKATKIQQFDPAMTQSAFWASVRLLTETVAAMPLVCYRRDEATNIKEPIGDYDLWRVLNYRPNQYQTRTEFFEQMMLNLVCWGNAYMSVQKVGNRITSLQVYPSAQMETFLLADGTVVHQYTTANGDVKVFSQESMWHVKIFGNGIVGLSPLAYAGNELGISKELGERQGVLAANGGKTNGILTIDQALKPEQKEQIKKTYKGLNEGNQDQLFILEAGFDYKQTSLSPTDMQLLESRRFSVENIARFMGVPSVLINDTQSSTTWGSGIEQINMGFYKLNLKPYLERIESSIKRWLMPSGDWETIDIEFDFDSLLRADQATRVENYNKAINSGQMTPNEARAKEGRKPDPLGNTLYINSTLVPVGTQTRQTQAEPNGN